MSTTIYNAYAADIPDMPTLRQFCADISKEYSELCMSIYTAETASETMHIAEYLPLVKNIDPDAYEKEINNMVTAAGLDKARLEINKNGSRKSPEEILEPWPALELAKSITRRRLDKSDDRGINAEMAIFPYRSGMLLIAFGDRFTEFMTIAAAKPEGLGPKYNLRDWHYQDQADKPENISESAWDIRKRTWAEVMPSGIPSQDGIIISIYDMDRLRMKLFQEPHGERIARIMKDSDPNKRLECYIGDRAALRYMEDTGIYDPSDKNGTAKLSREFYERYRIPGSRANKIMADTMYDFGKYMLDFTDSRITRPLLTDCRTFGKIMNDRKENET